MITDKLNDIENFWFAPLEKEFEYHELRDHSQDIYWLVMCVKQLQQEYDELKNSWKLRGKKIINLQNELVEQSKYYEELLQEKGE